MSWLTLLALQALRLIALLKKTSLLIFNDLASSLTLLTYSGLTRTLTCFTLVTRLLWYKHVADPLKLDKIDWETLENSGKLSLFNEKQILGWTCCQVISLYDVLLLVE